MEDSCKLLALLHDPLLVETAQQEWFDNEETRVDGKYMFLEYNYII